MDRWKSRGGKSQRREGKRREEKRKKKREDQRRERVRRKKMQVREKVKSRFTVFFQWVVAPEGRKLGWLKRRVRSHLARGGMNNCTPLWRGARFEVKRVKNWRSQGTLELRCWKSARRCGAKRTFRCRFAWQAQGIVDPAKSEQNVRVLLHVQKWWQAWDIWRGSAKMDFAWQAQYKRHAHQRSIRRSGRWFLGMGCILEHQIFRFAKTILCGRCSTSYDLASLFPGRGSTFQTDGMEKSQNALVQGRQLSTCHFWRKSRGIASFFPHIFVWGSCFRFCTPASSRRRPTPPAHTQLSHTQLTHTQLVHTLVRTHTQLSHTHNLLTHNLSTHNFLTHNLLTHNLSTHILSTHNVLTYNLLTYNLPTHNLSTHNLLTHNLSTHNLLTHTTCPHTTCPHHTQLTHTHNLTTHTTCPHHTQLTHTHTTWPHTTCPRAWVSVGRRGRRGCWRGRRGTWWHRPSLCVGGMALGDLDRHFGWHLWYWAGSGGALGSPFGAVVAASMSTFTLRGRRGTWWHWPWLCVAGVALMALNWLWWRAWVPVGRHCRRGCWRGRRGTWWHRPSLCVAGVALDIDGHFARQAWHLWHWTGSGGAVVSPFGSVSVWRRCRRGCWRGRRGTWWHRDRHFALQAWHWTGFGGALGSPLGAVVAAAVGVAGVALGDIDLHFAWQAWLLVTSTVTLRGRRGTCGTGLALVARLGLRLAPLSPRLLAWQAWHLVTSTVTSRGRRGTYGTELALVARLGLRLAPLSPRLLV